MNIQAVHLWPLLLLPVLGLFLLLSRKSLAEGARGRSMAAFVARAGVVLLLILAVMDIHLTRVADKLAVIFLLDKSLSVPGTLREQAVREIRKALVNRRKGDRAGMVVFGTTASIETAPEEKPDFSRIASVVRTNHTDIGAAIRLGLAAFPRGVQKRMVLLSDGNQNTGDAIREARNARANGAVVDVVPLSYDWGREVRLEKIVAPGRAVRGEAVPVRLVIHASEPMQSRLYLRVDGAIKATRDVTLQKGKNIFSLEHVLEKPGFHTFEAQVESPLDGLPQNNQAFAYTIVGGDPRLLIIDSIPDDARFLRAAFEESGIDTEVASPAEAPVTPAEFQKWDALVLSNVGAGSFSAEQLRSMEAAVRHLGMGLVMVGGEHSFGAGDYNGTPVEDALPVFAEVKQKKILPNGALVLVMHTCEFADGNRWSKEISKEAVRKLTAEDLVGLIYYDYKAGCKWLFELRRAAPKNELFARIMEMEPGDMPDFESSLRMAYQALEPARAGLKHVVIVSDGDPSPPTAMTKRAFKKSRITISTVCINPHGGGRDILIMRELAKMSGGRAYFPKSPEQLPGILIREAAIVKRNFIKEEPFQPAVAEYSEIMKGFGRTALPPLLGRVVTSEKPTATIPLRSPEGDPVLAHWRYGLGRTVAFTSDAKNRWAPRWLEWHGFGKFWGQIALWCLRTVSKNNFRLAARVEGGKGKIVMDALDGRGAFIDGLEVQARTVSPSSKPLTVSVRQTGPGRYEGEFDVHEVGTYPVMIVFDDGKGNSGALGTGMALSYSPEFKSLRANHPFLKSVAEAGNGKVRPDLAGVFEHDLPAQRSELPVWPALILASAFLFLLDVFIRRIALPYRRMAQKVFGWVLAVARKLAPKGARAPEAREPSMEALLKKKAEVARERETEAALFEGPEEDEKVGSPLTPASGAREAAPKTTPEGKGVPSTEGEEEEPFTKRLLDAKKRAWKRREGE